MSLVWLYECGKGVGVVAWKMPWATTSVLKKAPWCCSSSLLLPTSLPPAEGGSFCSFCGRSLSSRQWGENGSVCHPGLGVLELGGCLVGSPAL